jgi:hypothetical protein
MSTFISLNHLRDLPKYRVEKPYEIWAPILSDQKKTNVEFELCHGIQVTDARPRLESFDMEKQGFQFLHNPVPVTFNVEDVQNQEGMAQLVTYLKEMANFMQSQFHTDKIVCYDWRVRLSLL